VAGFDFFRSRRTGYLPRTPAAALKAVGTGTVPAEQFVYASASAKPLDEEPFDLEEIERVLARPLLDLPSAVLLKRVLSKLIGSREQEVALFGAEGINALESRALTRIEKLKTRLKIQEDPDSRRKLAREYYEMAELQAGSESVRAFYLREAFSSLCGEGGQVLSRADLPLAVDILVARRMLDQARQVLDGFSGDADVEIRLMSARVAFHRRDYRAVAEICRRLAAGGAGPANHHGAHPTEAEKKAIAFWAQRDA
jgi:hypothetical protein